jgi:hypothetical protein
MGRRAYGDFRPPAAWISFALSPYLDGGATPHPPNRRVLRPTPFISHNGRREDG